MLNKHTCFINYCRVTLFPAHDHLGCALFRVDDALGRHGGFYVVADSAKRMSENEIADESVTIASS